MVIPGGEKNLYAVEPLIKKMEDEDEKIEIRVAAIKALGNKKDMRVRGHILIKMSDKNAEMRSAALAALAILCEYETDRKLLTKELDGKSSWFDPQKPIDKEMIEKAAKKFVEIPEAEVRQRYERLAKKYHLRLDWNYE
jgi:HEAT repeat protein